MADLPPLPPEGTPFLDSATGRMNQNWRAWFKAFAPILSAVAESIEGVEGDLGTLTVKDQWTHTIAKVANVTARFLCIAETDGTIDSTYTDCASGTCTVRWYINGVAVGTTTNSVSTTAQTRTHSAANTFVAGDVITYTITSNSTCLEALLQANVTRDLAA